VAHLPVLLHKLGREFWLRSREPQAPVADPWDDALVPWWAVGSVEPRDDEEVVAVRQRRHGHGLHGRYRAAWERVVGRVHLEVAPLDPAWWVEQEPRVMAHAGLLDPRSFCQMAGVLDEDGLEVSLADFQVRGIEDMRMQRRLLLLWPFEHGKSFCASGIVPLMDWAEDPNATQIRVYFSDEFRKKFAIRLMWVIGGGYPRLQRLYPHIRRPLTAQQKQRLDVLPEGAGSGDDPGCRYWNMKAFSIGGSTNPQPSFRGLSSKAGHVGWRAWRVGCDDLVNSDNSRSPAVQEALWEYVNTGLKTMPSGLAPEARRAYGTRWGTLFVVGTPFDPGDVNVRLYHAWRRDPEAKVRRMDIYPRGEEAEEVLWPARKPLAYVQEMRRDLGWAAFQMRCRCLPVSGTGVRTFTRGDVEAARVDLPYGILPPATSRNRVIIGFDPAKGLRTATAKNPAAVVLAVPDGTMAYHVVRWRRLVGVHQQRQAEILVDWAHEYGCPIAFERNYDENVYRERVGEIDPSVRLICHTTTENKRDPEDGIPSWITPFENRAVRIHASGAPQDEWRALFEELTNWPNWQYSDLVIALWVAKKQLGELWRREVVLPQVAMPAYVRRRGLGAVIDLRPLRR
jgi:hypothetical protein